MKARSLQDLGEIKQSLAQAEKARAEEDARRREAERRAEAERHLFARAVGPVRPIADTGRAPQHTPGVEPRPVQRVRDEQAALQESLSDEFDVSTLLDVDDQMSFRRPGVGPDVTRKLRRGDWTIQGQIDLHGLRSEEAREALAQFVREAWRAGWRCVRVVHGKGLGSPGKTPVLKAKVQRWLVQKNEIIAFVQARPLDGGAGALVVLLAPGR